MKNIELIASGEPEFLNQHFIIPYFQRGYRWTEKEVTNLLDDILEFSQKYQKEQGEFYCLQPIVVLRDKDTNNWIVIDGQQRLTTLYILLSYLKEARKYVFQNNNALFSIEYQTRNTEVQNSRLFLENINQITEKDKSNADYYHMSWAYLTIKKWFESKNVSAADILNVLLKTRKINGQDVENNLRIIWYEVTQEEVGDNEEKTIEIFSRLNKGKIPLTNAELIKALYFVSDKNEEEKKKEQLQKGYEWDKIEFALQQKSFWYFLTKENYKGANHIEFIFELIADKYAELTQNLKVSKTDKLYTFYVFQELIKEKLLPKEQENNVYNSTKDFLWDEIKSTFNFLEDMYNDNTYYHLIGFLNHQDLIKIRFKDLITSGNEFSKKDFEKQLTDKIKALLPENIEELNYEDNYNLIKTLLLLFNVLISKNSTFIRFPFDKYHEQKWSLEHIHAQNSLNLSEKQKRVLLDEQMRYFEEKAEDLYKRIHQLLEQKELNNNVFNQLQEDIFQKYTDGIPEHSIKNMALLTVEDNSVLNNNIFPVKKDLIKNLDEKGSFIPIGTKNVFLKYYSKNVEQNVRWNTEDQQNYLDELKRVLKNYLPNS